MRDPFLASDGVNWRLTFSVEISSTENFPNLYERAAIRSSRLKEMEVA